MESLFSRVIPVLVLVAAWWPSRLTGLLDGAPLDNAPDAIFLGLLLPLLLWLTPEVFRARRALVVVVALLAWKAFASAVFVQDGWCTRVEPAHAYVYDSTGAPKNWDVRADWLSADPRCSAITTQAYLTDEDFPVWFFNLSPTAGGYPPAEAAPPLAVTRLTMRASIHTGSAGQFRVLHSAGVATALFVDGREVGSDEVALAAGPHDVTITATLTGTQWMLAPLWNNADAFGVLTATVTPASALDRALRPWAKWISFLLIGTLVLFSLRSLVERIGDWRIAAWSGASIAAGAAIAIWMPARRWHYTMLPLIAAAWLPVPERLRNVRGAFLLLAPFWLALHLVDTYLDIGFNRMQLLVPGQDWWQFQRYAYRIYMQGYWLEGGELTFHFRPLYRWIAGALHLLFGQSQTGENYWDAVGLLIMALCSFEIVRRLRGFGWGIFAGALALTAYLSGPGHVFIGRGLSDISSAAFLYLSVLCVLAARDSRSSLSLAAAGMFAVFAVWTRENNLPMALAIVIFAWPLAAPASVLWQPRQWFTNVWRPALLAIPAALVIGTFLFALRTWHYTGAFAMGLGTRVNRSAVWQPGMSWADGLVATFSSVMMVATTTDPARYHNGALPILAGFALSVVALLGVPLARRLPFALAVWTLSGFASALIVRGDAYSGRFSIHVVGCCAAITTCAIGVAYDRLRARRGEPEQDFSASSAARTS